MTAAIQRCVDGRCRWSLRVVRVHVPPRQRPVCAAVQVHRRRDVDLRRDAVHTRVIAISIVIRDLLDLVTR